MTTKELRILGWTCLIFGFGFSFADTESAPVQIIALAFLFVSAGCQIGVYLKEHDGNGRGPLRPA